MTHHASASIATGDNLDVRTFAVTQAMSQLFRVELHVVSSNLDIDFDEVIGQAATFTLATDRAARTWTGVCVAIDQVRVDRAGDATYTLTIAPRAYLLTQRKNYRIFQYKSELQIAQQILNEWGVANRALVDGAAHIARKYRTQYAETDYNFVCRMLEDAGISFYFEDAGDGTVMVLDDNPQSRDSGHPGVHFHDQPANGVDFVTRVGVGQRTRPGKMTIGDLDYRRPSTQQPRLSVPGGLPQEAALEQFEYEPGAFLYLGAGGGSTPFADDRGATRTDQGAGNRKTQNRLLGKRQDAKRVTFESNLLDLAPGSILSIANHPHAAVDAGGGLLVTAAILEGEHDGDWRVHVDSTDTSIPFRPEPVTPKPRAYGLESATVVGPSSDEIHCDEYARVRVHFHWDRESRRDGDSSCWLPTNQPWAGTGFGGTVIPRIGQEVLVEFFGGDPDRPVVIGRVFTEHQPPPYKLPEGKTITGLVGRSTPWMVLGSALDQVGVYTTQMAGPSPAFRAKPPQSFWKATPRGQAWYQRTNNAFLLEDASGENLVFLQAEKDLTILVKNAWKTVVGNYRGVRIGGTDTLEVKNKQFINVWKDQQLRVTKDQVMIVQKDRTEDVFEGIGLIAEKNIHIESKGVINHKAKKGCILEAKEKIEFKCGSSVISLTTGEVKISSPAVVINSLCRW